MNRLAERLSALSPAQRAELERRLKEKNVRTHAPPEDAATEAHATLDDADAAQATATRGVARTCESRGMDFSLFFFSGDGSGEARDKYRLLLECARFADRNGFVAVWTPERHFQPFGGLYPNPSVLGAALAALTERVEIRAGSVALPLHDPVRVAEEWSVVDNLSGGRVGVSFASGWHPADFALAPDAYERRKELMYEGIETVRRLWSGGTVRRRGAGGDEVEVRTLPRPVQRELPVWISISRSEETWVRAGEIGAHVLTAIVKQPLDVLKKRICLYRDARRRRGFDPQAGRVAVMLHTFVGEDEAEVREAVRPPLCRYFRANLKQLEIQTDVYAGRPAVEADRVTEADVESIAEHAFERYYDTSLLCGTPSKCARLVERLIEVGVDEAACLVDFGPSFEQVLASLLHLGRLREQYAPAARP